MIKELKRINQQTLNVIVYVDNSALQYYIENLFKQRFNVDGECVLHVNSNKEFKEAQYQSTYVPENLGRWLVNIHTDNIAKADLLKALAITHPYALNVYWVTKYKTYKDLINSDVVKKQGVYCHSLYVNRLSQRDIYDIFADTFADRRKQLLDDKLLDFVAESYQWDVQAVFDLIAYLKAGNSFDTKRDIVEAVGVGGNTVDKFTVNLLLCTVNSLAGKKKVITKYLKLLNDLSFNYKYSTIKNFMLNTVNGFIDMKQLQIMGLYRKGKYRIPDCFDAKRLARLRRYEWAVLDKITLPRLLLLRQCLKASTTYDTEIELIKAIIMYIDSLKDTSDEPLKSEKVTKSRVKKENKVEVSENYNSNIKSVKDLLLGKVSMDALERSLKGGVQ